MSFHSLYTDSEEATHSVQPTSQPADKNASLTTADIPSITKYLSSLPSPQIKILGVELGLDFVHLTNMNQETLLQDMVLAWLRRDDYVRETTWHSLIKALESVGHNGIAANIRKGEYLPTSQHSDKFCAGKCKPLLGPNNIM